MYERFTARARKVIQFANQEAQRFNHEYIGTEHILLGIVKEGGGVAANVLKNLDVDLRKIRLEVEQAMTPRSGETMVWPSMGQLPRTPRAKKVIGLAIEASLDRGDRHVGTEHLLIGLLVDGEGVAGQACANLGVTLSGVRKEMGRMLGVRVADGGVSGLNNEVAESDVADSRLSGLNSEVAETPDFGLTPVRSGLFVIRTTSKSDAKPQYWSCSTEHGTGWCAQPKQAFTKSELSKEIFQIIDRGWFQSIEIVELQIG